MDDDGARAFRFHGNWRDYAPIAFTNLLLTIVTLGFYRFWATTRTRRYLWSQTQFIDDRLEWTGTGMELFIGFLLVLLLLGIPILFLQFGLQAMVFQGYAGAAFLLGFLAFALIFYLGGVARFRMLRYRLSRTWWHGIRGGADDLGWGYGVSYMWRYVVSVIALYLPVPWAMIALWNERWEKMSFGPFAFEANATISGLYGRFLLFYLLPIVLLVALFAAGAAIGVAGYLPTDHPAEPASPVFVLFGVLTVLGLYGGLGIVALVYYAKFFRVAIDGLSLSTLDFHFNARTKDWFRLVLGDIALVALTLGVGVIFLSYRHWTFFVTNLDASGEIRLSELTQSTTRAPGQGEGLAAAFDIGAI